MELRIKPHSINQYPLNGILIRGASTQSWIKEIQKMELRLSSVSVHPIAGQTPNEVWGCLVILSNADNVLEVGRNSYCQCVENLLFIPEKSTLYPHISASELNQLLHSKRHILHPSLGFIALEDEINWKELVLLPEQMEIKTRRPTPSVFIPKKVRSFQVQSVAPEDVLEDLEKRVFPQREKFSDQPLNMRERGKLWGYKKLFQRKNDSTSSFEIQKSPLFLVLAPIVNLFVRKNSNWEEQWQQDYQALEKRNQKHIDRLLNLLKNNLEEALKYAIPLDEAGTGRGGTDKSSFELLKRWANFSLFETNMSRRSGSGAAQVSSDYFTTLQNQYHSAAQQLIQQGDYHKAAFVYMKLLRNYHLATQTLEKGKLYQDAASVYLKYLHNHAKAAECYEKGKMISEAIALYKELHQDEKVGDLYMCIFR